jgi:hypothetical protein
VTGTGGPLAAELARVVAASAGKRIQVADLLHHASRFDPGLVGDPASRFRFRAAIDELRDAGVISFPALGSRTSWDSRVQPPLPVWVLRIEPSVEPRTVVLPRVWPSALEPAAQIATRADEQELLMRIAAWLRENPDPERVPAEERSVELFDDEKALDGCLKTRLFTSGALSLALLACDTVPVPFVSQHLDGTGPTQLLVLENLATYWSVLSVLKDRSRDARPDLHIGWGHGAAFVQSVGSVAELEPAPRRVTYFGDLDLAGLGIAAGATSTAAAAGLPQPRPAESCYRYLLDGPGHWRRPDETGRQRCPDYAEVSRWLPESLRAATVELLQAGLRIPQERLGLGALRQDSKPLMQSLR